MWNRNHSSANHSVWILDLQGSLRLIKGAGESPGSSFNKSYTCLRILLFHCDVLNQFTLQATASQPHTPNQPTERSRWTAPIQTLWRCWFWGWMPTLCSVSSSSAEERMINLQVVMAEEEEEEGRDAMGLLSIMIGLNECCNGPGCQSQWFTLSCRQAIAAWRGWAETLCWMERLRAPGHVTRES